MATADKLTYLNETKNEIRKAIEEENLVTIDDTTTFREYANKIKSTNEEIKKYIPTDSQNGTSLQVTNAVPLNIKKGVIDGNSYQYTTKGNQLVDFSNNKSISANTIFSFEDDVLSVSATEGGYRRVEYDILELIKNNPNKILYFDYESIDFSNGNNPLVQLTYIIDGSKKYFTLLNNSNYRNEYTIPEYSSNITSSLLEIYCNNTNTSVEASISITKPMLQFGTDKLEYEQYTGGIASPNPDYPQEIEVVSGNNLFVGYENMIDGFLPQVGDYPTTNSSYPNAKYQLIELKKGDSITINSVATTLGRIRVISKETNKVLKSVDTSINDTYVSTADYSSGFKTGIITARKDFIVGIMLLKDEESLKMMITRGTDLSEYIPFNNLQLTNSGKNICPTDYEKYWEKGQYSTQGVKEEKASRCRLKELLRIKPNADYYCSCYLTDNSNYRFAIRELDKNKNFVSNKGLIVNGSTYTSSSNAYYIAVTITYIDSETEQNYEPLFADGTIQPLICLSSYEDKTFEPYRETDKYLIDLKDNFLAKIGDVKDTLDLTNGVLNKNIKKVVLDGSEDWNIDALQTGTSIRSFNSSVIRSKAKKYSKALASYLIYDNTIYSNDNIGIDINWQGDIRVKISSNISTSEELKNYLANNPLIVYYQVAKPETIQLDPINIKMYEGTNNIKLDTNLETNMSLEYYKDYLLDSQEVEVSEE